MLLLINHKFRIIRPSQIERITSYCFGVDNKHYVSFHGDTTQYRATIKQKNRLEKAFNRYLKSQIGLSEFAQ